MFTFKGGIHPAGNKKLTKDKDIDEIKEYPEFMIFPLLQHIGAVCEPIVKKGDEVKVGQKLSGCKGGLFANIYSSVSGTVSSIEPWDHPSGRKVMSVIIKNDYKYEVSENIKPYEKPIEQLTSEDVENIAFNAGIVGMGGAGFPTHIKISSCSKAKIDTLIINGAECEPYITSDYRRMLECPERIIEGIKILMQAFKLNEAYLGIEDNKKDAIEFLTQKCKGTNIKVISLKTKYPQGGEKQLIYAVTKREVPVGKLPMDAGCGVFNIDTCICLSNAYCTGMPVIERVITVSGDLINNPSNVLCKMGTPFSHIIEYCGGLKKEPDKIIMGGPMMGNCQYSIDTPVVKTTSSLLFMSEKKGLKKEVTTNCIRCGRCSASCPMFLMPNFINQFEKKGDIEMLKKLNVLNCIECGTCAYKCPAKIPLVQVIKNAKSLVIKESRKNG